MLATRTTTIKIIRLSVIAFAVCFILAYAIWRSLSYARGPAVIITEPQNGAAISSSSIVIRGQVFRSSNLLLNNNPVIVDEEGRFSETVIIVPGSNRLTLTVSDQFGRSLSKEIDLVGTAAADLHEQVQSTSTATSSPDSLRL